MPEQQTVTINQAIEMALTYHQSGQFSQAERIYQQVLQTDPSNASALNLLGLLAYQTGNHSRAENLLRQAIVVNQNVPEFHNHLGLALHAQGQLVEAIACYRRTLQLQPNSTEAYSNLGSALKEQGQLEEAVTCYRQALQLNPEMVEVHNNLAATLKLQNRFAEAAVCYRQALKLKPDFVEVYCNLGNMLQEQQQFEEAENCYRQVLQLQPTSATAHENLGMLLAAQGKLEEARSSYRQAIALNSANNAGIRIKQALLLPVIMGLPPEMLDSRRRLEENLKQLLNSHLQLQNPQQEAGMTHFYLVYQGLNDRDLLMKLASFYQQACPSLLYTAPHCQKNVPRDLGPRKINIGFISAFLKNHTIGRVTQGIIANLSRDQFRVHVFFLSSTTDDVSQFIQQQADYSEILSKTSLAEVRQRLAAQQLDILFYSDIGMDPFTYFLAFARLAPVQCVTYGHPSTTGIPTIDYFLSAQHLEIAEADQHYSEKLVRLNHAPIFYYKPLPPTPLQKRSYFGLEEQYHIYACPQSLFRFHPKFDPILAQILARDPDGQIVMIEGNHPHWQALLTHRFRQVMSNQMIERIRFLPALNLPDYLNLLAVVEVILDPFHFSSGNAAYEAFAMGTPIVNLPSQFLRGRIVYNLYQQMGVMDCIADTPQQYVKIALRLGTDSAYREQIRAKIRAANHLLYEDQEAVRELEQFFISVLSSNQTGKTAAMLSLEGIASLVTSGQLPAAEQQFRQFLRVHPENIEAQGSLGNLLREQGRLEEAKVCYQQILQLQPHHEVALTNLGIVLQNQNKLEEAIACYQQVLSAHPQNVLVCHNLGVIFQQRGQLEDALVYYQRVLQIDPQYAPAYSNLGVIYQNQGKIEECIRCLQQAIALNPQLAKSHDNLGTVRAMQGWFEEAQSSYRRALELQPNNPGLRIRQALLLPVILGLPQEILQSRQRMEHELMVLLNSDIQLKDPMVEVNKTNFHSVYQGLNDRDLQVKLASLYQRACPSLLYIAPHCQSPAKILGPRKINIGFVSRFFRQHTIGKVTRGIIAKLSREHFRVHVFFVSFTADETSQFIQQHADYSEILPPTLAAVRERIAAQQLDILFYSDIGMESLTYFLAFARLAPVQCVTWGHPVTTGIPTMDYFISSRYFETAESDNHYSEKLIHVNSLLTFYYRPKFPSPLKGRSYFGLADQHHIYLCPQSLFKLHPDFDGILARILRQDSQGQIVLVEGDYPHWTDLLKQRFSQTLPEVMARIRFLPKQRFDDYLNLVAIADVMLDPVHFGGGSTTYEALAIGLPIVTCPSAFLRGRFAYGCYQRIGVMDCVAESPQRYIEIALRLGTDALYREQVRAKIRANNHLLYEDSEVVRELEGFFLSLFSHTAAAPPQLSPPVVSSPPLDFSQELVLAARYQQEGQLVAAEQVYRQILQVHPEIAEVHNDLGNLLGAQGNLEEAALHFRQALQLRPDLASAYYNLGGVFLLQNNLEEAETWYRHALALNSQVVDNHSRLGFVLHSRGKLAEAAECYRHALELKPDLADVHFNLGNVLHAQKQIEGAKVCYRQAIILHPDFVEAYNNLGSILQSQYQLEEAAVCYRQALRLKPDFAEVHTNLGDALLDQNEFEEAAQCYRQALQLKPDYAKAHSSLGGVLGGQGYFEEALASRRQAVVLEPNNAGFRIKLALLLPVIMGLPPSIMESRRRMENDFTDLLKRNIQLIDPVREVGETSFFLAYHGLNDRDLQVQLATFYQRTCPSLLYVAPHCQMPIRALGTRKIKIGFISSFFRNHTIGKVFRGIIANLSRAQFYVHVFFPISSPRDNISEFIRQHADSSEILPTVLEEAHQQIAAQQLDILCYSDIGMDPLTYFLAFARLAPVQCVTWGHPDTTGIPTLDYFISSRYFETTESEHHYSEKLIRLNSLLAFAYRTTYPQPLQPRRYFGLADQHHIYLCPQALFKCHPDFDTILANILRRDVQGEVVLVEAIHPSWTELLRKRFRQTIPDVMERIRFVPRQNFDDYLNLMAIADVMLDPVHFGGGTTTYEAFACGIPIVTWPSPFMRGRFVYAYYQRMGMMECVADTLEQYVEIAVRLGMDSRYREHVKTKILAANQVLYEDMEVVREFEKFFVEALVRFDNF